MPCLIRSITGCPCPTCGVTRALLSLMQGDVEHYVHYNAMALPLTLAVGLFFGAFLLKNKNYQKISKAVSLAILIINIPYYLYRLVNHSIP